MPEDWGQGDEVVVGAAKSTPTSRPKAAETWGAGDELVSSASAPTVSRGPVATQAPATAGGSSRPRRPSSPGRTPIKSLLPPPQPGSITLPQWGTPVPDRRSFDQRLKSAIDAWHRTPQGRSETMQVGPLRHVLTGSGEMLTSRPVGLQWERQQQIEAEAAEMPGLAGFLTRQAFGAMNMVPTLHDTEGQQLLKTALLVGIPIAGKLVGMGTGKLLGAKMGKVAAKEFGEALTHSVVGEAFMAPETMRQVKEGNYGLAALSAAFGALPMITNRYGAKVQGKANAQTEALSNIMRARETEGILSRRPKIAKTAPVKLNVRQVPATPKAQAIVRQTTPGPAAPEAPQTVVRNGKTYVLSGTGANGKPIYKLQTGPAPEVAKVPTSEPTPTPTPAPEQSYTQHRAAAAKALVPAKRGHYEVRVQSPDGEEWVIETPGRIDRAVTAAMKEAKDHPEYPNVWVYKVGDSGKPEDTGIYYVRGSEQAREATVAAQPGPETAKVPVSETPVKAAPEGKKPLDEGQKRYLQDAGFGRDEIRFMDPDRGREYIRQHGEGYAWIEGKWRQVTPEDVKRAQDASDAALKQHATDMAAFLKLKEENNLAGVHGILGSDWQTGGDRGDLWTHALNLIDARKNRAVRLSQQWERQATRAARAADKDKTIQEWNAMPVQTPKTGKLMDAEMNRKSRVHALVHLFEEVKKHFGSQVSANLYEVEDYLADRIGVHRGHALVKDLMNDASDLGLVEAQRSVPPYQAFFGGGSISPTAHLGTMRTEGLDIPLRRGSGGAVKRTLKLPNEPIETAAERNTRLEQERIHAAVQAGQVQGAEPQAVRPGAGGTAEAGGGRGQDASGQLAQAPRAGQAEAPTATKVAAPPEAKAQGTQAVVQPTPGPRKVPVKVTKLAPQTQPGGKVVGIAQRIRVKMAKEGRAPEYEAGEGFTSDEMIARGENLISKGVDPVQHLADMEARPEKERNRFDANDIALFAAQDRRYQQAADAALMNKRRNPSPAAQAAYDAARSAADDWYKRISRYRTEWSNAGTAQQSLFDMNTGSYTSIRQFFEEKHHKPMTPAQDAQARQMSAEVTGITEAVNKKSAALDKQIKSQSPRANRDPRGVLKMTDEEYRIDIEKRRRSGEFYQGGKMGPESGAFRVRRGAPVFLQADIERIWSVAKRYIGSGDISQIGTPQYARRPISFEQVIARTAQDTGLTQDEVIEALTRNKRASRQVINDLYVLQHARRTAVQKAKVWVGTQNQGKLLTTIYGLNMLPRSVAVFGHGTVGMVTHGGRNILRPGFLFAEKTATGQPRPDVQGLRKLDSVWFRNFRQQWGIFLRGSEGSKIQHEQMLAAIETSPTFGMKLKAGLHIDPNRVYDDWQQYARWLDVAATNVGNKLHSKLPRAAAKGLVEVGERGDRGMDVLKLYRSELFDYEWNNLPDSLKQGADGEVLAKELAGWVNHATGAGKSPPGVSQFMFAGSLEASRLAAMIGDPIKVGKDLQRWNTLTNAERAVLNLRVKKAGQLLGTYAGLLYTNYMFEKHVLHQKDLPNLSDPKRSDFLKFKLFGQTIDPTGGLTATARMISAVAYESYKANPSETLRVIANYARGKATPPLELATELAMRKDYQGRPLPWASSEIKRTASEKGHAPYTTWEYLLSKGPIPLAGALAEYYDAMREHAVPNQQAHAILKALFMLPFELTGVRVAPTPKARKPRSVQSKGIVGKGVPGAIGGGGANGLPKAVSFE